MLPDEVICNNFTVTDNGFVVYWSSQEQQQNCRVKCPGGRIYPISDTYTFIFNGNLYSIRNNAIIQHKTIGNNDLEEKQYAPYLMNNSLGMGNLLFLIMCAKHCC